MSQGSPVQTLSCLLGRGPDVADTLALYDFHSLFTEQPQYNQLLAYALICYIFLFVDFYIVIIENFS